MADYEKELGKYLNFSEDLSDYEIAVMAQEMYESRRHAVNFKWIYEELLELQRNAEKERQLQIGVLKKIMDSDDHREGEEEQIHILKDINRLRRKLKYLWHIELEVKDDLPQQYKEAM